MKFFKFIKISVGSKESKLNSVFLKTGYLRTAKLSFGFDCPNLDSLYNDMENNLGAINQKLIKELDSLYKTKMKNLGNNEVEELLDHVNEIILKYK